MTEIDRRRILGNLADHFILPGYRKMVKSTNTLLSRAKSFEKQPNQENLESFRSAWTELMIAARRMQCLQTGPIVNLEYDSSFYYWRVLPSRIGQVLKRNSKLDQDEIEDLGSTSKGLFALEFLLYNDGRSQLNRRQPLPNPPSVNPMLGPEESRRRQYATALAKDLHRKAIDIYFAWSGKKSKARTEFIESDQQSIELIVNQLVQTIEETANLRLKFITDMPQPISRQLDRIENGKSSTSHLSVQAIMIGVDELFHLPGQVASLHQVLKKQNPAIADRLSQEFQDSLDKINPFPRSIELMLPDLREEVLVAYESCRVLEVAIKKDLAEEFDVVITFSSLDGD